MTWEMEATQRWPHAAIHGDGPIALVTKCKPLARVWLFASREEAERVKFRYDVTGCGAQCDPHHRERNHYVIDLPAVTRSGDSRCGGD